MRDIIEDNLISFEITCFRLNKEYNLQTAWNHKTTLDKDFIGKLLKEIIGEEKMYHDIDYTKIYAIEKLTYIQNRMENLSIELLKENNKQLFNYYYNGYDNCYYEEEEQSKEEYVINWYGDPGCWRPNFIICSEDFSTYEDINLLLKCSLAILELLSTIHNIIMREKDIIIKKGVKI